MKNKNNLYLFVIIAALCLPAEATSGEDIKQSSPGHNTVLDGAAYRFEFFNDFYFGTDSKLSGGWSLQKHSSTASSWSDLEDTAKIIRQAGTRIPTLTGNNLVYRTSMALGQVTQTPGNLSRTDLIEEDVPYAGALALQLTWYGFNNHEFRGFELLAGVVGPASLAEQAQKYGHKLIGTSKPRGWDNQLRNELIVNLNYLRKLKLLESHGPGNRSQDITLSGNICLGNMFTMAGSGLEMRYGKNLPRGFLYIPGPTGFNLNYLARLRPAQSGASSIYASLALRGSAVAHNIFLDGNLFKDSHSVHKKPFVGQAIFGLHYEKKNWAAHFNLSLSSDDIDTSRTTKAAGQTQIGTLTLEWMY